MPDCADVAATLHEHECVHVWHGYTQGPGRWGDGEGTCPVEAGGRTYGVQQGDRDCASSVIECWQLALEGTPYEGVLGRLGSGGATYTGDMRRVFVASGLFEWHPMGDGYVAQRGDVYLNEVHHTAMCQSAVPDMLSEFRINELGTITGGQVGDQTGAESRVGPYYDFPWDGVLAYNGRADSVRGEGRPVQLWPSNGTDAQRWFPEHRGDGTVSLRNAACGKYLDVTGGSAASGTPCQVYPGNGTDAQRWRVVRLEGAYAPGDVAPAELVPAVNGSLRLDVAGGSDEAGAGIQTYEANGTPAQQWYVMDDGEGAWTIMSNARGAKLALDVTAGGA